MKIKDDFILQQVADEFLVVPIGEEANRLQGIIRLNETGAAIWRLLESGAGNTEEISARLATEFDIEPADAQCDVDHFVGLLSDLGCIES